MNRFHSNVFTWVVLASTCLTFAAGADVSVLLGRIPDRDPDGKHTGPVPADSKAVIDGVVGGGAAAMDALLGLLVEPGDKEDYKARYALHAVVVHVTSPGRETARKQLVAALVKALQARPGTDICLFLIDELQFLHPDEAVDALAACLTDDNLYEPAVRALVAIGGGKASDALVTAFPKTSGRAMLAVMQALGDLRVAVAAPQLATRLGAAPDTAVVAGVALAAIGDGAAADAMVKRLASLEGRLRDEMTDACFVLAANLIAGGKRDDAFRLYRGIWSAMGTSSAPHVRSAIVDGLAKGLSSDSTDSLTAKLKAKDPATRAAVLHVLGSRKDATVFDAIAGAMKDGDAGVRLVAARTLPLVGGAMCVRPLVEALPGDDAESAHVLRTALMKVDGDGVNAALAKALGDVKEGERATEVRLALLDILRQRKAGDAADAVLALIGNSEASVRTMALRTLGAVADGNYAVSLAQHVRQGKAAGELRTAEDALVAICSRVGKGKEQVKVLSDAMAGADADTACALLRVMGRLGNNDAMAHLLAAVGKTTGVVQDQVVRSLADFPNERPAPDLIKLAKTTPNDRHHVLALRGYVGMAEKTRKEEERFAMLREAMAVARRPDEKKQALGVMGKDRNVKALKQVMAYVDDAAVGNEAALAAIRIGERIRLTHPDEVRGAMERIVSVSKDKSLQKKAEKLLKQLAGK